MGIVGAGDFHSKSLIFSLKRRSGPKIFFACGALKEASPRGQPESPTLAVTIIPVSAAVGVEPRGFPHSAKQMCVQHSGSFLCQDAPDLHRTDDGHERGRYAHARVVMNSVPDL